MADHDPPDLTVVQLHSQATAADVVGSLRRAADSIESKTDNDDRTIAMVAVQVTQSGEVRGYAWGKVPDRFAAMGMLMEGARQL